MTVDVKNVRDIKGLCVAIEAGARPKYLFFWGHQPQADGSIGKGVLSQWWQEPFEADGELYASAEHYMMAGKATLFGDLEMRDAILRASHPAEAKKLGRKVRGFEGDRWQAHRFEIVTSGNVAKFGASAAMRDYLLGTGDRVLVEASPRHRIWGVGLSANHADAESPSAWRGLNLLGFGLMEARARLGS